MTVQTVSTSPLVKRYTLQEFWELPEPPGGGHYELIGGVLYMVPPPSGPHNNAWGELNERLCAFVIGHPGIGRVFGPRAAIWIDDDTYIEPDLMFLSADLLQKTDLGKIRTADLVIEISSPSTAVYDRTTKADTYLYLGVRELWLVDTERRVIEQRVPDGRTCHIVGRFGMGAEVHSRVLQGFVCPVSPVFAEHPLARRACQSMRGRWPPQQRIVMIGRRRECRGFLRFIGVAAARHGRGYTSSICALHSTRMPR